METITLQYKTRNRQPREMLNNTRPMSLVTRKKSGLEEALEDVARGRLTTIHVPENRKKK